MEGTEYQMIHQQPPDLYVIRKLHRTMNEGKINIVSLSLSLN